MEHDGELYSYGPNIKCTVCCLWYIISFMLMIQKGTELFEVGLVHDLSFRLQILRVHSFCSNV